MERERGREGERERDCVMECNSAKPRSRVPWVLHPSTVLVGSMKWPSPCFSKCWSGEMLGKIEVQFICEFTAYGESFGLYLLYTVYGTYYTYLFFWLNIYSLGSSWITKFLNDDLLVVLMDTHTHTHTTPARTHTHTHPNRVQEMWLPRRGSWAICTQIRDSDKDWLGWWRMNMT